MPVKFDFVAHNGSWFVARQIEYEEKSNVSPGLYTDLPLLGGPPFKLEFGGYGRPVGLTVTQCRTGQQGEAR